MKRGLIVLAVLAFVLLIAGCEQKQEKQKIQEKQKTHHGKHSHEYNEDDESKYVELK